MLQTCHLSIRLTACPLLGFFRDQVLIEDRPVLQETGY